MKIFIFLFWLSLLLGFIAYIGQLFDITIINNIFDFFANKRILSFKVGNIDDFQDLSNYQAFGLPRLDGLFEEPGHYGQFLFLFLPMVYSFSNTKAKIYKNKIFNKVVKCTLIPFSWLSLILTLSPIFLCLSVIITIIYYIKSIKNFIKKFFLQIFIIASLLMIILISGDTIGLPDLSETYLSRIFNVLSEVRSYEDFTVIEPSLAGRICSYINALCVFKQHILFGVGYGNINYALFSQYDHSPVPLTIELIYKNSLLAPLKKGVTLENIISYFLAENGIIIFSIFAYFVYKLLKVIILLEKIYNKYNFYFNINCAKFLKYSIIALCINSIYNLGFSSVNMYVIFALAIMFIYQYELRLKNNYKMRNNDECNT